MNRFKLHPWIGLSWILVVSAQFSSLYLTHFIHTSSAHGPSQVTANVEPSILGFVRKACNSRLVDKGPNSAITQISFEDWAHTDIKTKHQLDLQGLIMPYDIEANHNTAQDHSNQGIGNQMRSDVANTFKYVGKGTAIILVIGMIIVTGITVGVTVGVTQQNMNSCRHQTENFNKFGEITNNYSNNTTMRAVERLEGRRECKLSRDISGN